MPTDRSSQCIQEGICFHGIADFLVDSSGGHTSEEQAILLEFLDFSCFLHAMIWEMPRLRIVLEGCFSIARSYHFISKGIKVLFLFGVSFKASFQLVELSLLFSFIHTYILYSSQMGFQNKEIMLYTSKLVN